MDNKLYALESQIRECYGRVVYTHTTHEKHIQRLLWNDKYTKIIQIIVSALISAGVISTILKSSPFWVEVSTAVLSCIQLIANSLLKNFSYAEQAAIHSSIAVDLLKVRKDYLSLLVDIKIMDIPTEEFIKRRESIQSELVGITKEHLRPIINHILKHKRPLRKWNR